MASTHVGFIYSIRFKLLAAGSLLGLLSLGAISSIMYMSLSNTLVVKEQEKMAQESKISSIQLSLMLGSIQRDILLMSNMPPLSGLIRAVQNGGVDPGDGSTTDIWRSRLEAIFVETLRSRSMYRDARLISVHNVALGTVKAIGESPHPLAISEQFLHRDDDPCFTPAIKLNQGETFIAEPIIYFDEGTNATTQNPVGCISTPVYDSQDRIFAIVILGINWHELFAALSFNIDETRLFYLANSAGNVLLYPKNQEVFFQENNSGGGLPREFPELYPFLLTTAEDQSLTLTDLTNGEFIASVESIPLNQGKQQFLLHLIAASPYKKILSTALIANTRVVISVLFIALLTLSLTLAVANSLTRPIGLILHALDAYEPGKPPPYLPLKRKDEIGVLARAYRDVMQSGEVYRLEIAKRIAERAAMQSGLQRLSAAVEQSVEGIIIIDAKGIVEYANHQVEEMFGFSNEKSVGKHYAHVGWTGLDKETYSLLNTSMGRGEAWRGDIIMRGAAGVDLHLHVSASPIVEGDGKITGFALITRDVSKRIRMEEEHRAMERQLSQAQKLESVGRLAAGIAHEINTPIQYLSDNTIFLQSAFKKLLAVLESSEKMLAAAKEGAVPEELVETVVAAYKNAKIDFLSRQIPPAFEESLEGLERVAKIVSAMKEFSHPAQDKTLVDLNRAIESTITVASNEWKYVAEMETKFLPGLPLVPCLPGEFNQVILNIIVNAAHAIGDVVGLDGVKGKGLITIETEQLDDWVEIRISDTGPGMTEEVKNHIFDAFFTTKEVGRGTGQGLSMAHNVVVDKLAGTIDVDSMPGEGTTFRIRLPLKYLAPESQKEAV